MQEDNSEPKVYKYRNFSENTDKIILNAELYFASHKSFNDPFDCNLSFRDIGSYTDKEFKEYCSENKKVNKTKVEYLNESKKILIKAKSEVGILSMSEDYKNILMWSHYADNHKGLCFGFQYGFYTEDEATYSKVEYPKNKKYKQISFFNPPTGEIKRMFTTKSKFWKYEKEIRLLDLKSEKGVGVKTFRKEYLKEIIFGVEADETNIKKIIQLCQMNGFTEVKFKKAKLIPGKFALDFDEINMNIYM
ncbi:MAG: hypothetical protein DRG78_13155 [Epsilonproteobacteria bacterium]|nr:MAG: hypothetical protein DRG78_13155 [Campylobacterota bacterium]